MYGGGEAHRDTTNLFTSLFDSKEESEGKMLDIWKDQVQT